MKKFYAIIGAFVLIVSGRVWAGVDDVLPAHEIVVFTQATCSHCWSAKDYVKEHYPDLTVQWRDISDEKNWKLMLVCASKFKIDKNRLGTPLFCMGQNYILGWGRSERKEFDEYVKDFNPPSQVSE